MLKTNKFKTLLVLLATVLGLTGITSTVYADKTSDKKTIDNMALQFVRYSTNATGYALAWAEKNTTGKAYANPYKFSAPGKSIVASNVNATAGLTHAPSENNDPANKMFLKILVTKIHGNKAIAIVERIIKQNRGIPTEGLYKHKIWFKKINNQWKISDYYTLLSEMKSNGTKDVAAEDRLNADNSISGLIGNPYGYDSKGNKFPY